MYATTSAKIPEATPGIGTSVADGSVSSEVFD